MLDHKAKPWLIEINHSPSFTADTPLDKMIKSAVVNDALVLMNISQKNRLQYKLEA
jgi:tubulin polyglutamylase TTLL6/13